MKQLRGPITLKELLPLFAYCNDCGSFYALEEGDEVTIEAKGTTERASVKLQCISCNKLLNAGVSDCFYSDKKNLKTLVQNYLESK